MLNIILIDDDEYALGKMQTAFNWEAWGYCVVGTFTDARSALDFIKDNHIDVVLTDIKMPVMDGLELAKFIADNYPQLTVVILSAYNDFSYAQKAIKYRVFRYLLKPIDFKEFKEVFMELSEQLDSRYDEVETSVIRRRLLDEIEMGIENIDGNVKKKFTEAGLSEKNTDLPVAIIRLSLNDKMEVCQRYGEEGLKNSIEQITNLAAGKFKTAVHKTALDNVILWAFPIADMSREVLESEIYTTFPEILTTFNEITHIEAELDSVKVYDSPVNIDKHSCEEYCGAIFESYIKEFIARINQRDIDAAYKVAEKFKILCTEKSNDDAVFVYKTFFAEVAVQLGIDGGNYSLSYDRETLDKTYNAFINKVAHIFDDDSKRPNYDFVEKAIRYVDEHYMEEVTLEKIAKKVYVSPKYFSTVFKRDIGISFSEYLLSRRIQKAVEYIMDSEYKMYEIGEMIGYKSERQFFRVFKKYTGCTPTEYRSKLL